MGLLDQVLSSIIKGDSPDKGDKEVKSGILLPEELLEDKVNIDRRAAIIEEHYENVDLKDAMTIAKILKRWQETYDLRKHEVKNRIEDETGLPRDRVETIMWTERFSIQCCDSVRRYQDGRSTPNVEWLGPGDGDVSPVCRTTVDEIDDRGGSVSLHDLQAILREKAREYDDEGGTPERMDHWVPHEKCRYTITPVVE